MLVVCGPNASGKTRLAVDLALVYDGEILSADSRQVYRGMDLGTGKDLQEYETDRGTIPVHLIDLVEPTEQYTLQHYIEDFRRKFGAISRTGRLPILAGGTGLYIEAVLRGYRVPNVPEDPNLRERLMHETKADLEARLRDLDPDLFARTDRSSKKRVVRGIEIALRAPEEAHGSGRAAPPFTRPLVLGVRWPRRELIERIDHRLDARLDAGMVGEVRALLAAGVPAERLLLFGMEYKLITRYLLREISEQEMVERLRIEIHQLAKRQMTWFRGMERRGVPIHWIERADLAQARRIVDAARAGRR
ncbi:MAG: tRNA (adenosine(37)-N6)-dimethylallyltransferase MiaA [Candidatus Eisenbacteria bacterium]|nr:tRNA (adenosine(37)-N6)-dimethylallyltransferase MiaA [Candidatus Latescibacterota bacterium]MBD3301274.1 tRNA (adenosine(37)-N6)-dimethylallyltransferase MiaA [Candidatus Eisenbacteria bacterium]